MGPELLLAVLAVGGTAIVGIRRLLRESERRGGLPPRVTIAAARPGTYVQIVGRIVEGESRVAPITGRVGVGHDAAATTVRLVPMGDRPGERPLREYHVAARSLRAAPFVLDDGTGRALVDPRGAYLRIALDHTRHVVRAEPVTIHAPELMADVAGYDELLLEEGVLTIGSEVVVHATVRVVGDGDDATLYRAQGTHRIELVGATDRSAIVSNLPANLEDAYRTRDSAE